MADIELKPCPFCGGEAEIVWEIADIGYYSFPEDAYHARCTKCSCNLGGVFGFETEEEAAEAWNRRADDDCPEKHGRWIYLNDDTESYLCSKCGAVFDYPPTMFFCPICGLKMDEEGGEKYDKL